MEIMKYESRRRFVGPMLTAALTIQLFVLIAPYFVVFTPLMHTGVGISALLWMWYAYTLEGTAVAMFNWKEYFRVQFIQVGLYAQRLESEGIFPEKNSTEPGTKTDIDCPKEDSDGKQEADTDQ